MAGMPLNLGVKYGSKNAIPGILIFKIYEKQVEDF